MPTRPDRQPPSERMTLTKLGRLIEAQGKEIHTIASGLADLHKKVDGLDRRLDNVEKRLESVEKRLDSVEKKVEELQRDFKDIKIWCRSCNQRLATVEAKVLL